jgi:ComF family protein
MTVSEFLIRLVAPHRCAGCGKRFDIINDDRVGAFCDKCRAEWEKAKIAVCNGCGHESAACICEGKYLKNTRILSVVKFGKVPCCDRFIYALKQRRVSKYFEFAADELYRRLREEEKLTVTSFSDAIVTNVPRNTKTRKLFGFDHAEILAESVAELMETRYESLIGRSLGGRPQKNLNESDRRNNVKGRFFIRTNEPIVGEKIILVDDVMTTGATASECVNELRKCGAAEVIVLTLARTENKKSKK